jgi:curved DNA-binding protein CbpA
MLPGMTSPNNLEINGTLREHPLAELLIEIAQVRLNGSLRIGNESQKAVFYFDAGEMVFAVSNAKALRLFEILLRENKIAKEQLEKFPEFINDFLLGQYLLKNKLLSKSEIDRTFTIQIEEILQNCLDWTEGDWIFSPLVRVKGDIRFKIEINRILINFARNLPDTLTAYRFKGYEGFAAKSTLPINVNLSPRESFVFSRFENSELGFGNVKNLSGLPESETSKILYTLWLGGFINRQNWKAAFSEQKVSEILSASISLVKQPKAPEFAELQPLKSKTPEISDVKTPVEKNEPITEHISLDTYLSRAENGGNFYELLAIEPKAAQTEIKHAYFSLAKRFHPDLFHKEANTLLQQRVQQAFTKLAQAYDTLRYEKSREIYDYKIRKDLETREKRRKAHPEMGNADLQKQFEMASDAFDEGCNLLLDGEFEAAISFLGRAVHLANNNARFHAFYGKALSVDKNQRHKAEMELQTAVKLEPSSADFRIMLAEFFMQVGLAKRAEGELNRLLAVLPDNKEARILLDSLQTK